MPLRTTALALLLFGVAGWADVPSELATMLEAHPAADADKNGSLTEQEAADYIFRELQGSRKNRGTGIRSERLIEPYEARSHGRMLYRLMKPLRIEAGKRYPLIVSLHGSGGVGDDNLSNLRVWNGLMARDEWRRQYPAFVIVPQRRPGGVWGPRPDDPRAASFYVRNDLPAVFTIIESLREEFPIDADRLYVIGSSGGGVGVWKTLAARPDLFAAAIPVCPRFSPSDAERVAGVPIWLFHGDADPLVSVDYSRKAFDAVNDAGGNIKYTELAAVKHNAWVQAFAYQGDDASKGYRTRYSESSDRTADVWKWLFQQRR